MTEPRPRAFGWLVWAALVGLVYAWLVARWNFLADDAFISFRYARHLAAGQGLVYNVGVQPPVEGYSNLLWVLWLALFERFGADLGLVSRTTSIACGVALLALFAHTLGRRTALPVHAIGLVTLLLASLAPFAVWSTSGLAAMPLALALFGAYVCLTTRRPRPLTAAGSGAALALAVLIRADGVGFAALVVCGVLLSAIATKQAVRARASLAAAFVLAATFGAHLLWRHGYHGDWVPNTAHVKAGFSVLRLERGGNYVVSFLLSAPACLLLVLALPSAWRRGARARVSAAATVVIGTFGYAIFVGGDFMPHGRFLMPAIPFLALIFAIGLERFASEGRLTRGGYALAGLALVSSVATSAGLELFPRRARERFHFRLNYQFQSERERWSEMSANTREWTQRGKALALHTKGMQESMILGGIGAIGYYSDLFLYDTYGLVTREVALRDAPLQPSSPGHDKRVQPAFFVNELGLEPTYLGSLFAPAGSALDYGLPGDPAHGGWDAHPLSKLVDVLEFPLPDTPEFPAGQVLRLVRFRR